MVIKRILFFSLIIYFSFYQNNSLQAQCKGWFWTSSFGGESSEYVNCIQLDSIDNSSYICGSYSGDTLILNNDTIHGDGSGDAFIVKYDSTGTVLWADCIGGIDSDYSKDLSIDILGNLYCAGDFRSDTVIVGSDTLTNNGDQNIFIIKYASDGSVLWSESEGGDDFDFIQSVAVDISNNIFVVGGYESSEIIFGMDTLINEGSSDAFIFKYNNNGEHDWAKKIGGGDIDYGKNVIFDNSGFVYVTGIFKSDSLYIGSQLLLNMGELDFFISKLDTNGNIIWVREFGGNNYDYITDIVTDDYGNIYITGNFQSDTIGFDNTILLNKGENDIFYAKLDNLGSVVWAKSSGGAYHDIKSKLDLFNANEVYLSGCFRSQSLMFDSLFVIKNSSQTGFIVKFDANGNAIWTKIIGDADYKNNLEDLAIDKDGDIYLTGKFNGGYISFGLDTILNTDITGFYSDIYTLKLADFAAPPIPQITQFDDTLISDTAFKYQWYYEDNYIWQAIQQKYIAPQTGYYFVEITDTNSCKACSQKLYVIVTKIADQNLQTSRTFLSPNPFRYSTLLKINPTYEKPYWLDIISINGIEVRNYSNINSNEILIKKDNLQQGLYFYRLKNRNGIIHIGKVLIQ